MSARSRDGRPDLAGIALSGLATVVGLALLSGCPGHLGPEFPATRDGIGGSSGSGGTSGSGGDGVAPPPCDAPTMVFQGSCAASGGCHTATDSLTLVGPDVEMNVIGVKATQTVSCNGMNLVNPTPPADGVLLKVLTGNSCGIEMPIGPALMPDQIDCIRGWINSKL
ncbi:MAG TPA: hypothetical protein VIU64_13835 [Polyangia bacterium]